MKKTSTLTIMGLATAYVLTLSLLILGLYIPGLMIFGFFVSWASMAILWFALKVINIPTFLKFVLYLVIVCAFIVATLGASRFPVL